tara:strand:- start:2564 stop:3019 length:456 start_codon:yes stop_codon:yes gene_type:complete
MLEVPSQKKLMKRFMKQFMPPLGAEIKRSATMRPPPPGGKLTRQDKRILRMCATIPRDGRPPWRERRDSNEKRCKMLEKKQARISKKAIGSAIGFIKKSNIDARRATSGLSLNPRENRTLKNCRSGRYRRMRPGKCRAIRNKARALEIPTW